MSPRILLIQHDPIDAKAVQDALVDSRPGSESFQVEWVTSSSEALTLLSEEEGRAADSVAAVLVDLFLPDSHGIETFDRLFLVIPHIPILVIIGPDDEDVARLAVQHGAQDYLTKGSLDRYSLPKALATIVARAANAEKLFQEQERAQVTLNSIGDAVISVDVSGCVVYLNIVAERMTGWSRTEAKGHSLEEVFHVVDATTRDVVQNPMAAAILGNATVALTPNCILIRRDGAEADIEDSAAPIHDRRGRVSGAVMVFHDVTTARELSTRMAYLAHHDSLTNLPNRTLLHDRLTHAIALAQRHDQGLAVLFLDLDRFKHTNDSLGHAIGDRLLQSVAQRLTKSLRSSDTVGRPGGDEFVIVLSDVRHELAAAVSAHKLLEAMRVPYAIGDHNLHVTGSIGIATYPADGSDAETLIRNADLAMYHAKESGRNNYQFFKHEMNVRAIERQRLEDGMRHAIEHEEFVLEYQPKVNLETGRIIGAEALVRWRHPERGLVPPGQFIPIAEENGLIVPVGRWVLRHACQQAMAWKDAGLRTIRIATNVSAVELQAKDYTTSVRDILVESGLEPDQLELELTETFLMQDSSLTANVLQSLKDMGVHLTLDDFGTGYSSLSYLKKFPIDSLKIDRSFVRDLTTDADDASIVSAVISMGNSLHMAVVAEGVETREQLAFLRDNSCPEGQGFYFSRPITAEAFGELLSK